MSYYHEQEEDEGIALDDAEALQEMFAVQVAMDAREVRSEMATPTVLRVRAEMEEPVSYRMLAMRVAKMGGAREEIRERALRLLDHLVELDTPGKRENLKRDAQRALEACRRVLESTDMPLYVDMVRESANAVSHFVGQMSTLLAAAHPQLAHDLANISMQATQTAEHAPAIAAEMKAAYERVRREIDAAGPQAPVPVSIVTVREEREAEPAAYAPH